MTRRVLAWALSVTTIAAAGIVAAASAPNEKLVLVTVVADESKPATGLAPADFVITEDKKPIQVAEAVPATEPLSIVLVVDTSLPAGAAASTPELRRALTSFVETVQAREPGTQFALYQVANAALPLTDFTSSRDALQKGIDSIASGTPAGSAMLEGVVTATKRVGAMPAPRRAIVCLGVGTAESSSYMPADVGNLVRKSGATLWVVSMQRATDQPLTSRDLVWTRATADSGGLRQNAIQASRLDAQMRTVANSLLSQYTLKIVRTRDGAVKKLEGHAGGGSPVLFTHWMR